MRCFLSKIDTDHLLLRLQCLAVLEMCTDGMHLPASASLGSAQTEPKKQFMQR